MDRLHLDGGFAVGAPSSQASPPTQNDRISLFCFEPFTSSCLSLPLPGSLHHDSWHWAGARLFGPALPFLPGLPWGDPTAAPVTPGPSLQLRRPSEDRKAWQPPWSLRCAGPSRGAARDRMQGLLLLSEDHPPPKFSLFPLTSQASYISFHPGIKPHSPYCLCPKFSTSSAHSRFIHGGGKKARRIMPRPPSILGCPRTPSSDQTMA